MAKKYKVHFILKKGDHPPVCGDRQANETTTDYKNKKVTCGRCLVWMILRRY